MTKKPELYDIIKRHKPPFKTYVIDNKASKLGFKTVRLPPYHCHYNAIETFSSDIKSYDKERITAFELKDIENILMDTVENGT